MRSIAVLLAFFVFSAVKAHVVTFKGFDINTGNSSSYPRSFCILGSNMLFAAATNAEGNELWITDGTITGTKLLKDICLNPYVSGTPDALTLFNGKVYFTANDSIHGRELWVTDGTTAGTQMVTDITVGMPSSFATPSAGTLPDMVVYNGKLYFTATNGTDGPELWTSDGTASGTQMVKDIQPGSVGSNPWSLTVYNSKLYFIANNGSTGKELWESDGTASGTKQVKDIYTGTNSSNPQNLNVCNGKLYFRATDGVAGYEPYVSDGTSSGTFMLKDIKAGSADGAHMNEFIAFNGKVWFQGDDGVTGRELWCTDGTTSGTVLFNNITPGLSGSWPTNFIVYRNKLYFGADATPLGNELWCTDGTVSGTTMIINIAPSVNGSFPSDLFEYNSYLFFVAMPTASHYEFYMSDGTTAGTSSIRPVGIGTWGIGTLEPYMVFNGELYFGASDTAKGVELWALKNMFSIGIDNSTIATNSNFTIYPNPNTGTFTIETNTDFKNGIVSVYDMMGRECYKSQIPNSTRPYRTGTFGREFQVTLNQPKGIYLVKLQLDDAVLTKRVAVE